MIEGQGEPRKTIEILAEDLSHQLSWYSATAYVLPHLAALCPRLSREDRVYLIAQMGAAIAAEAVEPLADSALFPLLQEIVQENKAKPKREVRMAVGFTFGRLMERVFDPESCAFFFNGWRRKPISSCSVPCWIG